jgi:hypothetical protein
VDFALLDNLGHRKVFWPRKAGIHTLAVLPVSPGEFADHATLAGWPRRKLKKQKRFTR